MTESADNNVKTTKKKPDYKYKPLAKLSTAVTIGFALQVFFSSISILGVIAARLLGAGEITQAVIPIVSICDVLHLPLYLINGILFMIWMRRGYRNVSTLKDVNMSHGEWLCIWGWLLPVVCWYIPASIVGEIWKASNPESLDNTGWRLKRDSKLVVAWWLCFIFEGIVNLARGFISARNYSSPELIAVVNSPQMFVFSKLLFIAACFLAVLVVRDVTSRQERKHALLAHSQAT